MSTGIKKVRVNGKLYTYPRNYVSEYADRTTQQKQNRVKRRHARSKLEKYFGKAALKGKDVHHVRGIGGGNGKRNLKVVSIKWNRSKK